MTITLDEATARWARVEAARRDTSVSDFVGSLLRERMRADQAYERAMAEYLGRAAVPLKAGGSYPRRDDLYDRG